MSFSYSRPDGAPGPPPPTGGSGGRGRPRWWLIVPVVATLLVLAVAVALLADRQSDDDASTTSVPSTSVPASVPTTPPTTSGSGGTSAPSTPTTVGPPVVTTSCAITEGLVTRDCAILTPPDVEPGARLPAVVLLPGFGDGPVDVRSSGDWANAVVDRRFLLVSPGGIANSWNAGTCCGIAQGTGIDDTGYLAGLVERVAARPDVDPDRIYLAGFSNGGMMVYRFLCSTERIAAAASVSGTKVTNCPSKRPIPILHIHGTADETVPYDGGSGIAASIMGITFQPVPTMATQIATEEGCPATPGSTTRDDVTTELWTGCRDGTRFEFITIENWPHQWPLTGSVNATDEVLDFFGIG